MIKILTWNIQKKKNDLIYRILQEMLVENSIDILVLQEAYGVFVTTAIGEIFEEITYPGSGVGSGVRIFLKKGMFNLFSVQRSLNKKLVFIHLKSKTGIGEFNIAAVHLYSKAGNSERQQLWKNLPLIQNILDYEESSSNNKNTIIVGDFNHNPFENNLCDPSMINSIGNKKLITMLTNYPITKKELNLWYNPMWNLIGDYHHAEGERVTGTYFRYTEDESPIWNLFDGYIVRPSLMDKIVYDDSKIITKTNSENFLKPLIVRKDESLLKEDFSDHLPVKLSLKIN
jgi:exonuclease III